MAYNEDGPSKNVHGIVRNSDMYGIPHRLCIGHIQHFSMRQHSEVKKSIGEF